MSKALCKTCGETTENIYCRCACQREPKPQYDIITELKAEIVRLNAQVKALCKYNGELEDFVGDMEDAGARAASILDKGQKAMIDTNQY